MEPSVAYHEPSLANLVIISLFLLVLNGVNYVLDKLVYCGLVGQVLVGMAWGTPGAGWLTAEFEDATMQLGYLGLILIVFEGGLSTSIKSLKSNLTLSSAVATTGIGVPIALSFLLMFLADASPLQAFSAGAALCSTSLGTTFTVLGTSGLSSTRLGVVLTSAAMMDDVVGLIMVQVVSTLGSGDFSAVTVVRPLFASLAFAILIPLACHFIARPVTVRLNGLRVKAPKGRLDRLLSAKQIALSFHIAWLFGLVIAGTAAGASNLLAAYLAGATISWWDSEVPHVPSRKTRAEPAREQPRSQTSSAKVGTDTVSTQDHPVTEASQDVDVSDESAGVQVYHDYYAKIVEHILKPFFFASIGLSIPITRMFTGTIVWRGVIYATLMALGKLTCGVWLLSFTRPIHSVRSLVNRMTTMKRQPKILVPGAQCVGKGNGLQKDASSLQRDGQGENPQDIPLQPVQEHRPGQSGPTITSSKSEVPKSMYPSCILALSMVARGEIGYLISALAESSGVFGREPGSGGEPSELFLIVTWAITLCTMVGPVSVGLLVRRVKRLESRSEENAGDGRRKVLGSWGVSEMKEATT